MKFNKNILIAGAAIISMAACQGEMKQPTDAEIDKLVEEKVAEVKNTLQQECDNAILAAATAQADSIMVAAANKPAKVIKVPVRAKKVEQTTTSNEPVKTNPKKDKMSGNASSNVQDKKDKMSGKAVSAEESLNKKKSKMGGK